MSSENSQQLENTCAILYGIDDIRLEHKPVPEPGDDEVLLEMACVGICGSDVHYWKKGSIGDFVLKDSMVMGHEGSGIVSKVGAGVRGLKPGDRVAIEPGIPCALCDYCKGGKYNLCRDIKFCATPPHHGNISKYFAHMAAYCYKLPDNVSLEEGALLEPLSVGVHACKRGLVGLGSNVLILGCGPIGLVTLLAARAFGASKVCVTDVIEHKLQVAKELGADETIAVKDVTDEEILKRVLKVFDGGMPDAVIDCSGYESTIRLAIATCRPGGIAVIVGMGQQEVKIPMLDALTKEIDIRFSFRYANDYKQALALVASGKLNAKRLITHNYRMENTVDAFHVAHSGSGNAIKVMIHCRSTTDFNQARDE